MASKRKAKCRECNDTGWMEIQAYRDNDTCSIPCKYCPKGGAVRIAQIVAERARERGKA